MEGLEAAKRNEINVVNFWIDLFILKLEASLVILLSNSNLPTFSQRWPYSSRTYVRCSTQDYNSITQVYVHKYYNKNL